CGWCRRCWGCSPPFSSTTWAGCYTAAESAGSRDWSGCRRTQSPRNTAKPWPTRTWRFSRWCACGAGCGGGGREWWRAGGVEGRRGGVVEGGKDGELEVEHGERI